MFVVGALLRFDEATMADPLVRKVAEVTAPAGTCQTPGKDTDIVRTLLLLVVGRYDQFLELAPLDLGLALAKWRRGGERSWCGG